jgi:hypothetical protein
MAAAAIAACTTAPAPRVVQAQAAPAPPPKLPPLAPAEIDNSLAIGGEAIKARKSESRMTVDVRLNGHGPYAFIVDSGADTSVVGMQVARNLQLPAGPAAMLNSMTARTLVDRVNVDSMTVGSTNITGLTMPALREEYIGAQGLIGIDALVQQRLLMDFEKRVIRVESARRTMKFEPGMIVITAKRRHGQLILTHVRAGRVSLDAVIDTGSEVTIGNSALRDQLLLKGVGRPDTMDITGVTGTTIRVPVLTVDQLQMGPILLQNVPIAFADVPPFNLFGLMNEPALLIGTDVLENFRRVSLDFRARKVRFQLKRCDPHGVMMRTTRSHTASLLSTNDPEACGEN